MKPIELSKSNWMLLEDQLKADYPISWTAISWRTRERLGFVKRVHTTWDHMTGSSSVICLDFYDDKKRTMFLLKYAEFINKESR